MRRPSIAYEAKRESSIQSRTKSTVMTHEIWTLNLSEIQMSAKVIGPSWGPLIGLYNYIVGYSWQNIRQDKSASPPPPPQKKFTVLFFSFSRFTHVVYSPVEKLVLGVDSSIKVIRLNLWISFIFIYKSDKLISLYRKKVQSYQKMLTAKHELW